MAKGRPPAGRGDDHRAGRPPGQRQLRVGELIRHTLSDLLRRDVVHDPQLAGVAITVSEVRLSPDLKNATVFVLPLAGHDTPVVVAALNRAAAFLRGQVSHDVELRFAPRLGFVADTSFDEADRIRSLLDSPQVRHDLDPGFADDDE